MIHVFRAVLAFALCTGSVACTFDLDALRRRAADAASACADGSKDATACDGLVGDAASHPRRPNDAETSHARDGQQDSERAPISKGDAPSSDARVPDASDAADAARADACVASAERCDGRDNDCDPYTLDGSDEAWLGCPCDGPDEDRCREGVFQCTAEGRLCTDTSGDAVEACDGRDNDCDQVFDEGCTCTPGHTQRCYTGPEGTDEVGDCSSGMQTCLEDGSWGPCRGDTNPTMETPGGGDEDCDGVTDEAADDAPNAACE